MDRFLRGLPTRRLLLLCAGLAIAVAACATIAAAALSTSARAPAPKPLTRAVHDAIAAPAVPGITARVKFTNRLIDSSVLGEGGTPLLTGATGRLWLSRDGRARIELQGRSGDVQAVWDRGRFLLVDGSSNTAYRGAVAQRSGARRAHERHAPPSEAQIRRVLAELSRRATVSAAIPGVVAGRPAYSVHLSPRRDGGLLGGVQLAWDAAHGVPLRVGIYARGASAPVLELVATDISFGPVPASSFDVAPPHGAKVVDVATAAGSRAMRGRSAAGAHTRGAHHAHHARSAAASRAALRALPFTVSSPPRLAGLARAGVRAVRIGGHPAAVVAYGRGLGGLLVVERAVARGADPAARAPAKSGDARHRGLELPTVSIGAARGQELVTALGSYVAFERGGVSYTVVGSVPRAVAEAAARGL